MPPITGWFDPTSNGGAVRLAANSYLPAKGDAGVRLPGLRRGDLVTMDNGRVTRSEEHTSELQSHSDLVCRLLLEKKKKKKKDETKTPNRQVATQYTTE